MTHEQKPESAEFRTREAQRRTRGLSARPIRQSVAFEFIDALHRHHDRPTGWLFGISAVDMTDAICGVCVVGRPSSRKKDDGLTVEITRLCTDGTFNACSFLYGAAWRAARAIGYRRGFTFTDPEESGASLRASGWVQDGETPGRSWSVPSRERSDKHPLGRKIRWRIEVQP
ncbi:XF1762 family protein [Asaia siamensis]|uniref:XF1762 family protein n=1 Tax=Asaia siamensis TaxID=110479 RepID=UPI0035315737